MKGLNISISEKAVSWNVDGRLAVFLSNSKIVQVLTLSDGSGFVVLTREDVKIVELDGNVRCSIGKPDFNANDHVEPSYAEYVKDRLHIVYGSSSRDYGVFVDENSCNISGVHEER